MLAIATAMAVLFSWHCIPNRGALHRQDLFIVSLTAFCIKRLSSGQCALFHDQVDLKQNEALVTVRWSIKAKS